MIEVDFEHEHVVEGGRVRMILGEDFACLDRPIADASEDAWAVSNPSEVCG